MSGDGYQGGNGGWGGSGNGTWGGGANDTWGGDGGGGGWGGPSAQDIGYAMMVMSKMGGGKGEMMMNMMSGGCGKGGKDSKGGKGGKDGGKDGGKGCGKDGGKGKGKSGKSKNVQQFPKKVKTGRNFFSWKGEVCTAFSRDHKVPPTKENIIYTTLALDGGLFMSTITCDKFSTEYSSEEAFDSKRLAEEACALAALMSEYPAHYASIPDDTKEKGAQAGAGKEDLARMAADGEEAVQPRDADVQYMKERRAGGGLGQFPTKQPGTVQQPKRVKTGRNYFSWKSEVCTAYSREHKASPTKESIVYTTLALDGGLFMSTVTSDKFSVEYSSEEAFDSGRLAEEACAMAALMGEYPAAYAAIPDTMKEKGAMAGAGKEDSARMEVEGEELVQPKKRKAGGGLGQPTTKQFGNAQQPKRVKTGRNFFSWKGEICNAYSRHHKVPPTKQSISYTTVELDGGLFMSTLKCDKFPTEYSSEEACDSKRLAEETCALAALMGEYPAAYAAFPDSTKEKGAMAGAGKEDAASMGAP